MIASVTQVGFTWLDKLNHVRRTSVLNERKEEEFDNRINLAKNNLKKTKKNLLNLQLTISQLQDFWFTNW